MIAAVMLLRCASWPRFLDDPSFRIMTGWPAKYAIFVTSSKWLLQTARRYKYFSGFEDEKSSDATKRNADES
jgi:hypothetical protein